MTFAGLINALFRPAHPTPPKLGTRPFVGMINDRFGSNREELTASSGLPLKADIAQCSRHVSKVPTAVMAKLAAAQYPNRDRPLSGVMNRTAMRRRHSRLHVTTRVWLEAPYPRGL